MHSVVLATKALTMTNHTPSSPARVVDDTCNRLEFGFRDERLNNTGSNSIASVYSTVVTVVAMHPMAF